MARTQERKVVADLQKKGFVNPSRVAGASLPSLNTRAPSKSATSIMQSFAGFNEAIQQLGVNRQKNKSAEEALKARNEALAGEYDKTNKFDTYEANLAYETTFGSIEGTEASSEFAVELDELVSAIGNEGGTIREQLDKFELAKSELFTQRFGADSDHNLDGKTEAYKSQFLPPVIKALEGARQELLTTAKIAWDNKRKKVISRKIDIITNELDLTEETFDSQGNLKEVKVVQSAFGINKFLDVRKSSVALNMKRNEANLHILTTVGLKASEEGRPELLEFMNQTMPNGFKLSDDPALNKMANEYRNAATNKFIQLENHEIKKQNREKKALEDSTSSNTVLYLLDNIGDPNNLEIIKQAAKQGGWSNDRIQSITNFNKMIVDSDLNITPDHKREIEIFGLIAGRKLTSIFDLSKEYGNGINLEQFNRLKSFLQEQQKAEEGLNAFTTNKDTLEAMFQDSAALLQSGTPWAVIQQQDQFKSQMLREFDEGMIAWKRANPGISLNDPEAFKFADNLQKNIVNASEFNTLPAELKLEGAPQINPSAPDSAEQTQQRLEQIEQRRKWVENKKGSTNYLKNLGKALR